MLRHAITMPRLRSLAKKSPLLPRIGVSLIVFLWVGLSSQIVGDLSLPFTGRAPAADRPSGSALYQNKPTPTPFYNPTATPPTQGGHGHDLFYIYCMSCHGDQGQGLTDEFRNRQYPPEDTNCWKSGCHGNRPYENGFTLPKTVPALIGPGTLTKFATAQNMYDFMRTAMPFNKPGSLSQEQYLQVLAFLLEQNHIVPSGARLEVDTLQNIVLQHPGSLTPTPVAPTQSPASEVSLIAVAGALVFLIFMTSLWIAIRRRS